MRRLLFAGAISMAFFTFTGCATLFGPATHPLAISSEPAAAMVFVNGFFTFDFRLNFSGLMIETFCIFIFAN